MFLTIGIDNILILVDVVSGMDNLIATKNSSEGKSNSARLGCRKADKKIGVTILTKIKYRSFDVVKRAEVSVAPHFVEEVDFRIKLWFGGRLSTAPPKYGGKSFLAVPVVVGVEECLNQGSACLESIGKGIDNNHF